MQWTEENLAALPTREGCRLRGEAMTRIEVFSDAAFAFAVTMLVISLESIPRNFEELLGAIKSVPAFAASFSVITVFWMSHRRWSSRFGLEDGLSNFLTLTLVFVILVYVYPLKLMMNVLFFAMSGGWLPSNFDLTDASDVSGLVMFYGVGFCAASTTIVGLYMRAESKAAELCLNQWERLVVKEEKRIWVIQASVALVSTALAALFFNSWGYLAGVAYASVAILIPWLTNGIRKEKRALLAPVDEIGDGSCEGESSSDASDCSDCHQ